MFDHRFICYVYSAVIVWKTWAIHITYFIEAIGHWKQPKHFFDPADSELIAFYCISIKLLSQTLTEYAGMIKPESNRLKLLVIFDFTALNIDVLDKTTCLQNSNLPANVQESERGERAKCYPMFITVNYDFLNVVLILHTFCAFVNTRDLREFFFKKICFYKRLWSEISIWRTLHSEKFPYIFNTRTIFFLLLNVFYFSLLAIFVKLV